MKGYTEFREVKCRQINLGRSLHLRNGCRNDPINLDNNARNGVKVRGTRRGRG